MGIEAERVTQLERAARRVVQAWRMGTIYELYQTILDLDGALGGRESRVIEVARPPEEMYEGAACSITGN